MALSQWDQKLLAPSQQQEVLKYQAQWATADDATRKSLHSYVEGIRNQAGYSGGVDGSQYIPVGTPFPTAPTIPDFNSEYSGMGREVLNDYMNIPEWEGSEYSDLIQQQMSKYASRNFEYNPETDPAYQAFKSRALAAGDKAYADNLGGMSAMTGGRPNTWAGTVASQARNAYVLESEMAVTQFEDRAYSRYRDEGQDMLNFIGILDSMDTKAYNQYRDSISDKRQLFDMVMTLEGQDFEKYKFTVDQTWKQFDTEVQRFNSVLDQKRQQISDALDRTNMLGYVDNEASSLLGVAAGTLSQGARERAEKMLDYAQQQQMEIESYAKKKAIDYNYDMKLIAARASSGGSGGGSTGDTGTYTPTKTEGKERDSIIKAFGDLTSTADFARLSWDEKYGKVSSYIEKVVKDYNDGLLSSWSADEALTAISGTNEYRNYFEGYENWQADKEDFNKDPLGTLWKASELAPIGSQINTELLKRR